jgi:hypothetical protein
VNVSLDRALSLIGGLITGAIAIVWPLLFISNEFHEGKSAEQLGHHALLGDAGAAAAGLAFAGILWFVTYRLLRFPFKGPKSR